MHLIYGWFHPVQTYESIGHHSVKQGWMAIGSAFERPHCLCTHKSTQSQNQNFQPCCAGLLCSLSQTPRLFGLTFWIIVTLAHTALTNSNVKGAPCPCIWYRTFKLQQLEPANIGSFKCAYSTRQAQHHETGPTLLCCQCPQIARAAAINATAAQKSSNSSVPK